MSRKFEYSDEEWERAVLDRIHAPEDPEGLAAVRGIFNHDARRRKLHLWSLAAKFAAKLTPAERQEWLERVK